NFSVRNGKRWSPYAVFALISSFTALSPCGGFQNYLDGRKKAYSHLFAEISPPVPKEHENCFTVYGVLLPGYSVEGREQEKAGHTTAGISEGGISAPGKEEKPSVLGKLSAAREQEKAAAEPKAPTKKKEDMQI
ncbi:MAG: hypothetical protein HFI65_07005, partial [Lachnospiraceae bacterium]|nr:hypothetical protein [Lachnospiraceae bacterium]